MSEVQAAFLPQLVDFNWRIDTVCESDAVRRMNTPTCLLQLQIKDDSNQYLTTPSNQQLTVELTKETLDTMLDGLGKIKDQLNSVVAR